MEKIIEDRHPGESWLQWKLGNLLTLPVDAVRSLFAWAWLFRENGRWVLRPRRCGDQSLFYNAVFFLRLTWPLGLFWTFRWSGATDTKAMIQGSLGFKLNGRFTAGVGVVVSWPLWYLAWRLWQTAGAWPAGAVAALGVLLLFALRIQSDQTSAAGVTGPNLGQATGFDFGTH